MKLKVWTLYKTMAYEDMMLSKETMCREMDAGKKRVEERRLTSIRL
jgi:hypothetical protein